MLKFVTFAAFAGLVTCEPGFFGNFFGGNSIESTIRPRENSNGNGDPRIVGGETSPIHYPYQLSLQMRRGGGGGFFFFQQPSTLR